MKLGNIKERISRFPVGATATFLGAATLSNVYASLNFTFVRDIFMVLGLIVVLLNICKIFHHKEIVKKEVGLPVPASIFCTTTMLMMLLGSYLPQYSSITGKIVFIIGLIFHLLLILGFTYLHVIKDHKPQFFVPSWFIVYNGIMVAGVVGKGIVNIGLLKIITIYGIGIFFILLPLMVKRVISRPLPIELMHTKAIFLAPISLCVISYINIFEKQNYILLAVLYGILLTSLAVIIKNIFKFFSVSFNPGFGALTFPMAIGTVASLRMASFLKAKEYLLLHKIVFNLTGIQLFLTTVIIGFVVFNFFKKIECKN